MTVRKTIVGLSVLCALLFSVVAAANASAATGTTLFTCSKSATVKDFTNADCTSTTGTKEWGHVAFTGSTPLQTKSASAKQVLTGTLAGIAVELEATGVEVNTTLNNTVQNNAGPPMSFSGETALTYTGVTVKKPEPCKVPGGKVSTKQLKFNSTIGTTKKTTGVKFEPATGTTFAEITLEGCGATPPNGTYPVKGTVTGYSPSPGSILAFSSESESLTLGGNPAVLTGETTQTNRTSGTALSATTITEP